MRISVGKDGSIIEEMGAQDLEVENRKNNCIILRKMLNKFEKLV